VLPQDDDELLRLAGLENAPPPHEGLFRDSSWLRRVGAEPALLLGGGRALLLEVAHPLVAAGVAEHSNFERDPFGRLQRTLDAMRAISFGDRRSALAAARAVERAHLRVRGRLAAATGRFPAGTPYSGRDPGLVLWVWATLVDTALKVYERFVEPLPPDALAAYHADQAVVARLLGASSDGVPRDPAGFRRYVDGVLASDVLAVGEQGRAIARAVLDPAQPLPAAGLMRLLTAALLPERLREAFGLAWDAERAARLEALVSSVRSLRRRGAVGAPGIDGRGESR
jgi:uncharacterized protein (DUF2236 family)